uniref:Dihydrolipoamide acetyltransferase component of pyruvate dehydrogenase complex n=1 Tax=Ciona savignyi TaxID=51511 RepID=H2ZN33_CIOSA
PFQVQMPALSPTMEEGTITKWLIAEGDSVEIGDAMCEVETDKAVVTMEANEDGKLAKILVIHKFMASIVFLSLTNFKFFEGTRGVKVNSPIAILAEDGEDLAEAANFQPTKILSDEPPIIDETLGTTSSQITIGQNSNEQISPAVRQILNQYNVAASNVTGTGPKGIRLKGDILKYIAEKGLHPIHQNVSTTAQQVKTSTPKQQKQPEKSTVSQVSQEGGYDDLEISNVRKVIAKRLTESKQTIPHAYSSVECSIHKVLELRKQLAKDGVKVSVNDFIIKSVAFTLRRVPEVNVTWSGNESTLSSTVDVSVAVATDGGLITPIVTGADRKGLSEISEEIRELASKARSGKLKPHEYQGGSFTISNLGMFGVREFTAVINPPQACIMAVGTTRIRPKTSAIDLDDDAATDVTNIDGSPDSVMTVTMSSDARVVDDELASKFLHVFKRNLENPLYMG